MSHCKSCNAGIVWLKSKNGRPIPFDREPVGKVWVKGRDGMAHHVEALTPHWATCPTAMEHRGKQP